MDELNVRIHNLEIKQRRYQRIIYAIVLAVGMILMIGAQSQQQENVRVHTLTAEKIVLLDGEGRIRIIIGEDPEDAQRRSRAFGITLFDKSGVERAGINTMEDQSVVLGMDAPTGVGASMRDRIGLVVEPDGSARIDLINNQTKIPVRLVSDTDGTGGVEFYEYDLEAREVKITRLNHSGSSQRVVKLDGGK